MTRQEQLNNIKKGVKMYDSGPQTAICTKDANPSPLAITKNRKEDLERQIKEVN